MEASQSTREQAGALLNDTKDAARSMLGEQQKVAASGLGDFAGALRRAARETRASEGAPISRIAESAADGLQRFSDTLRNKDLDGIVREAESFARRQPVAFIGAAALVGFLAMRFLKSTSSDAPPASRADGSFDAGTPFSSL